VVGNGGRKGGAGCTTVETGASCVRYPVRGYSLARWDLVHEEAR
jgi:hypothetical protein